LENKNFGLFLPAYLKDEFLELEKDRGEKASQFYTNVRGNQSFHFLPYPALKYDETVIIDLRQLVTIPKNDFDNAKIQRSLSLQGYLYFQNRLILPNVRELKNRDDKRVLKR
jgi:hypothetical protein